MIFMLIVGMETKTNPSWEEYEKVEKLGTGSYGTVYKSNISSFSYKLKYMKSL